jgi:uncharacterized membrane protein
VAANWSALGRYAKFGLAEAVVVASVVAAWRFGIDRLAGKAALLLASLATGALLALVGQTYQTGADTYELFASWAALILPWILVARFGALWMLWLAIVNLAVLLYFQTFPSFLGIPINTTRQAWALFIVDTAAWVAWEGLSRRVDWLGERWPIRLLALTSGATITGIAAIAIADRQVDSLTVIAYLAFLAALYVVYRTITVDLFMLAGACLSIIVIVAVTMLTRVLGSNPVSGLLFSAVVIIAMTSSAAIWLRRVATGAGQ